MKAEAKKWFPFHFGNRLNLGIDITEAAVRGVLVAKKGAAASLSPLEEVPIVKDPQGPETDGWIPALQKLLKHFSLARAHVNVSLPSRSIFITRYQFSKISPKAIGNSILEKLEEDRLPFPLEDTTISFAPQTNAPKGTYLVACAERKRISPVFSALYAAGATSCFLLPSDRSVINCLDLRPNINPSQTVATLRFGQKELLLSFFDEEGFRLRRIISIGREELYKTLLGAECFSGKETPLEEEVFTLLQQYPLDQAIEREIEEDLFPPPERIYGIVLPILEGIAYSIQKTFHFYKNSIGKSPVNVLYLLDDFKGLDKIHLFLKEKLQVEVEFLNTMADMPQSTKTEDPVPQQEEGACFTTAVGIALEEKGDLSLIPREEMFLPKLRIIRIITRLTAGILSLAMILFSLFYTYGFKKLKETARISHVISVKIDNVMKMENKALAFKVEKLRCRKVIEEVLPLEKRIPDAMRELTRLMSPFVSLDQLSLASGRNENSLEMRGIFAVKDREECDKVCSAFINSLETSVLFEDAAMKGEGWKEWNNYLLNHFTIEADLTGARREEE